MSSENTVKAFPLVFGTAGTRSAVTNASTDTSNPYSMPRQDFSLQLTVGTTGTSGYLASVVLQGSNDNVSWLVITSATASATSASAAATVTNASAVVAFAGSTNRFAMSRLVGTFTGTGSAVATLAS